MQIGIDIGATKIESVILDENGTESFRERIECPKNYIQTVETIKQIVFSLDKKLNKKLIAIMDKIFNTNNNNAWSTKKKFKNFMY